MEMELDILCVVGGIILCVIVVVGHGSHAIFYDLHKFLVLFQDHLQNLRVCGGWLCVGSGFFYRGRRGSGFWFGFNHGFRWSGHPVTFLFVKSPCPGGMKVSTTFT